MRILCVGGGPAGLYFSILVKRARPDWSLTVIERNAPGDTFGWGVVFSDKTIEGLREADPPSHDQIQQAFRRWEEIDVFFRGRKLSSGGHGFSGIARRRLLSILETRAKSLGVDLRHGSELTEGELDHLIGSYDLVVGADGVNSVVRRRAEALFNPRSEGAHSRYLWLGTEQKLDAFTFDFQHTEAGWFALHAYRFDDAMSTAVIEVPEATWRRLGLDSAGQAESISYCERLFAERLDGCRLIASPSHPRGSAVWQRFTHMICERWYVDKCVLLGDAAHTAHFSVGSGTKLALEDAMALAGALTSGQAAEFENLDVAPELLASRLQRYQERREPEVRKLQVAALNRMRWFETVAMRADMAPEQFAYSLLTGSERVSHRNLQQRDTTFVACYEAWLAHSQPVTMGFAGPPHKLPIQLRGLCLKNRLVSHVSQLSLVSTAGSVDDAGLVLLDAADIESSSCAAAISEAKANHIGVAMRICVERELFSGNESALVVANRAGSAGVDMLDVRFSFDACIADNGDAAVKVLAALRAVWPLKPICGGFVFSSPLHGPHLPEAMLALALSFKAAGVDVLVLPEGDQSLHPALPHQSMYAGYSIEQIRLLSGVAVMVELANFAGSGATGRIQNTRKHRNGRDYADTMIAAGRADLCLLQ